MPETRVKIDSRPMAAQIARDYGTRIYDLARRILGSAVDAEDVAQDVLLRVVEKLDQFRGDAAPGTWIYRITVNAALQYRQRSAQRPLSLGDPYRNFLADGRGPQPVAGWSGDPQHEALGDEAGQLLAWAIRELPHVYCDVYLLAEVQRLPISEVADLLGITTAAAKSRLHRARLALRKKLAPYFEPGSS